MLMHLLRDVQEWTKKADKAFASERSELGPATYGTTVHTWIKYIYDVRTGQSALGPGRLKQISSSVLKHFGPVPFVVLEVKPIP